MHGSEGRDEPSCPVSDLPDQEKIRQLERDNRELQQANEILHGCPFRAPCLVSIDDVPVDQQTACPWSGFRAFKFFSIQINERKIRPVIQPVPIIL